MPTYSYRCTKCDAAEHEWRRLKDRDEPHSPCKLCGNQVNRVIFMAPGMSLAGHGWHNQEYSKTGPKERKR